MPFEQDPSTLNDRVISRIRAEMAAQRVSQAALAYALGRNQTYVSYRLTCKTAISLTDLEAFARALAVPIERLLFGESPAQRHRRAS